MKKLLIGLLVSVIFVIAGVSYLGFMPVFSKLLAKPVDLGATVDPNFVVSFESKYGTPDSSGRVDLNVDLSANDITSVFAKWEERDKYFPLHKVQVKFNADGTGEASGLIKTSTVISLAKNLGYSDSDIETGKKYVQYIAGDIPFYVKGTGGMLSNTLSINPSTFQIGRVTVPETISKPVALAVSDMIKRRLTQIGGADIKEASFRSGMFHLDGSVPATIKY